MFSIRDWRIIQCIFSFSPQQSSHKQRRNIERGYSDAVGKPSRYLAMCCRGKSPQYTLHNPFPGAHECGWQWPLHTSRQRPWSCWYCQFPGGTRLISWAISPGLDRTPLHWTPTKSLVHGPIPDNPTGIFNLACISSAAREMRFDQFAGRLGQCTYLLGPLHAWGCRIQQFEI